MITIRNIPILLIILAMMFLAGCTSEEVATANTANTDKDETEVLFKINVPDAAPIENTTRAQSAAETKISTVDIFVFTQKTTGGEFTYDYAVQAAITSSANPTTTFKARIKSSTLPSKLFIIANASLSAGKISEPPVGTTEATAKQTLAIPVLPGAAPGDIPMWGEYLFPIGISPAYDRQVGGIKMYRVMAKVTLGVEASIAGQFVIKEVHIGRARMKAMAVPQSMDAAGLITAPNVSAITETDINSAPIQVPLGASFYLAEDDGYGTFINGTGNDTHTCIIIGASLNGGAVTYYRLDTQHDNAYGKIIRNYEYKINIKKANSLGKSTIGEALTANVPSLTYEVNQLTAALGITTINFDNIEELSSAEKQIILMPESGVRDIPLEYTNNILPSQLKIYKYVGAGPPLSQDGITAHLINIGSTTATIVQLAGKSYLRITSPANTGTTDMTDAIIIDSPHKRLMLNVVKKSNSTIGISATVVGATTPNEALFLPDGGTKTVTVNSSTPWVIKGLPSWITAKKISDTQLTLTVSSSAGDYERNHTFTIENQTGKTVAIIVKQQYKLEWARANTKGGKIWPNGPRAPLNKYTRTYNNVTTYYYAANGSDGTLPIGFASNAEDVGNVITASYSPTAAAGNYPEQFGDLYEVYSPSDSICPPGWRLPTIQEAITLADNIILSTSTTPTYYIVQNGLKVYFPGQTGSHTFAPVIDSSILIQKFGGTNIIVVDFSPGWQTVSPFAIMKIITLRQYLTVPQRGVAFAATRCVR